MARQMKITIRQNGLLILKGRKLSRVWCPACAAEREMFSVERSSVFAGATPPQGDGHDSLDLHRLQVSDGSFLVCLKSLIGCVMKNKPS